MRILVVEDEHRIANAIKKGLEQERYAVDAVYDGEGGFDLAATENYDTIVLDLMLPKMDGLEICRRLRRREIQTPILILSAKGQLQDGAPRLIRQLADVAPRVSARRGDHPVSEDQFIHG